MEVSGAGQHRRAAVLRRRAGAAPIWIPVEGASMGDTIAPGGRVLVDGSRSEPRRGEIWAFEAGGRIVVHRFRSRHDGRFWLRGDGNRRDDRPVSGDAMIGRVTMIDDDAGVRRAGRLDRWRGRARLDGDSIRRRFARWGGSRK